MAELTYKSKIYLTSSSSVKDYNFAFDYINKTYIKVKIGVGTEPLKYGSDYTVVDHTIRFVNNPPNEQLLEIYRETPTDRTVEWYDSSILRAKDLNLYNIQMLHINEENIDKLLDSGIQEDKLDSKWDGRLKVLKNLADPVEEQDAVTKSYLSKTKDSFIQQATILRDTAKQHADIAVANAKQTATVKQSVDTTKAAIDVIKSDIDTQHAHIHQDHEHIHQDVAATGSNREAVTAMTADVTAKHTEVLNARNDVVIKSNIATQAANTATQQATIATQQAEEAKHYADIAGEVAGGNFLTKLEAHSTYLPLDGGTITGDLTVNGAINGTATKALTADTQENTDNSTKVATTEFVQNVTQEKVSAESDKTHQLVEKTFNGLNTKLTETKDNLGVLTQYVANQSTTTWERQKAYAVGDIVYSSKLPPGYYLECVTAGTTDATEPIIPSNLSTGVGGLTDGTCVFEIKELDRLTISGIEGKTDLHSALHRYGDNPTDLKGLTNEQWHDKGMFISYFSKPNLIENQPNTYGQLINLVPSKDSSISNINKETLQLFLAQADGDIFVRGGNDEINIKDEKFKRCVILKDKSGDTSNGWRLYSDGYFEYWRVVHAPTQITYPFPVDNWEGNIQATPITDYGNKFPKFLNRSETGFRLELTNGTNGYFFINVRGYIK